MSVLFRRSNFFIDFKTMTAYTDLYVTERLIEWGVAKKLDLSLFTSIFDDYNNYGPKDMKYKLQTKVDVNFLLGYIDWGTIAKLEEADPVGFCDKTYNALLFQEFDVDNSKSPKVEFTPLADTIRMISKDKNTEQICIYTEYPCKYIEYQIAEFMQSDKIKIITGDKEKFLKENTFDSYFFENVDDIEFISRKHSQRSEVIIPGFPFNITGYDFDKNGEVIYSQDSLFKVPILDKTPTEYLSEYNLDIALIDIPL